MQYALFIGFWFKYMNNKEEKKIIGRLERVDQPEFDLKRIEAKIDTGAYNGAIHVSEAV